MENAQSLSESMFVAGVIGASLVVPFLAWKRFKRRRRKGLAWSDDSPRPASTHNLKR